MYTVTRTAELARIAPDTLRAWQRRYQMVTPHRSDAGYRLYDDEQVTILREMAALVSDGVSPRRAAELVQLRPDPTSHECSTSSLLAAAASLDPRDVEAALDEAFATARGSAFDQALDDWLLPQLALLGESWRRGETVVAQEHLVSAAVMRLLSRHFDELPPGRGPTVVVGAPPGSRHEIGLLCFAVSARRRGLDVVYLGADVPLGTWLDVVRLRHPRAIVLTAAMPRDVASATRVVALLASQGVREVLVGGSHAAEVEGTTAMPQRVTEAARLLDIQLRAGLSTPLAGDAGAPRAMDAPERARARH